MILPLHIIIALTSIFYTGYTFVNPSNKKFTISYVLVASTLVSGTYLVIMNASHLVSACMTGIVYLAFVTAGLVAAHRRMAKAERGN